MSDRATHLHQSPWAGVFYTTGGGVSLFSEMLGTPGASATVLEATVPYAQQSLTDLLGRKPDQATARTTARQMATVAWRRARQLAPEHSQLLGFGCTASLATNRTKRGRHRAHWAIQTATSSYCFTVEFDRQISRETQETLLVDSIWQSFNRALHRSEQQIDFSAVGIEHFSDMTSHAPANYLPLLEASPYRVCTQDDDGLLLLPGSFNPIHDGHVELLKTAEELTGRSGAFELAVQNADKPPLDFISIEQRLQRIHTHPVWLTNTPRFTDKAQLFPGAVFALGTDTLVRIGQLKFYQGYQPLLQAALQTFHDNKIRFLVFGRRQDNKFVHLDDLDIPDALRALCEGVDEDAFRADISSSELREHTRQAKRERRQQYDA